jgi:hypothetical protein
MDSKLKTLKHVLNSFSNLTVFGDGIGMGICNANAMPTPTPLNTTAI